VEAELDDVGKPASQALLYRAARELLTNIGKHAKATTVKVGLTRRGDRIVLTIADDGTGFDPSDRWRNTSHDGHIGLGSLLALFDAMGGAIGHRLAERSRHRSDSDVTARTGRLSRSQTVSPRAMTRR